MIVLKFGQESETHKEPQFPLGQHARSPDNRRYYYSQNGPAFVYKGVTVAAEIPKNIEVITVVPSSDGKGQMAKTNPGIRVGITECDVKPGEYFWMLTWGPGEILVDWMEVSADPRALVPQSLGLCWMYESDLATDGLKFCYMTTAA